MDNEKLTIEQFGAKIRTKYPQYLKLSNVEVATKVLNKYPQYAQSISDLPKPEEKKPFIQRAGKTIGNLFTGETQKLGTTLGQIKATPQVTESLTQSENLSGQIEVNLIKQIRKARSEGRDTSRMENALTMISGRQKPAELVNEIIPGAMKSNRQVLGEVVGTGAEALSGGIIKGTKGIGLAKTGETALSTQLAKKEFLKKFLSGRLKQIGKETLSDVASILPIAYTVDVAQNLQQDKTGMEAFKPGMATLLSTVIPLGIGGIRAGRQIAADTLSNVVSPNLSGVQSKAYERLRTGDVNLKNAPSELEALNEARSSATAFKQAMQQEFGQGKENLIVEMTGKRIGLQQNEITKLGKIAERFGFEDRLPQNLQNMSVKETMDLLTEINNIPIVKELDDPLVKNLKLALADIKDSIKTKAGMEEAFGSKFSKIYETYSKKATILRDVQSVIGKIGTTENGTRLKLNPQQTKTAVARLQSIFKENGTEYLKAIKMLEEETGQNILDRVAASQLSRILPKTLRTASSSFGHGIISDVVALLTLPLSSPRFSAFLISQIGGYGRGVVTRLLNANPKIRKAIYDAVVKERMSFSDAVELYAIEYIKNPKLGASIEDISKRQIKPNNSAVSGKITQTTNKTAKSISIKESITPYKETGNLTTKILKDLEGKTTVSKQYILDATNRPELKQVERDLIREALVTEKSDTINVSDFAKKVKAELLPLKLKKNYNANYPKTISDSGYPVMSRTKFESISLPSEIRGNVKNYDEHLWESPIKTSAGQTHFPNEGIDNYFGHTRIEEMADGKTVRVIEGQTDLYQKGNLEREMNIRKASPVEGADTEIAQIDRFGNNVIRKAGETQKMIESRQAEIAKLQQYDNRTSIFRMFREEMKYWASKGKTKLQFPTGETAMKIEGLGQGDIWHLGYNQERGGGIRLTPDALKVGEEVVQGSDKWVITDVLGDGKFKAVPKEKMDLYNPNKLSDFEKKIYKDEIADPQKAVEQFKETFDISGKVDTSNPIYKFYEKDVQKYLNKFGGKRVVDEKGVSWIEVPIKKEWAKMPVEAFALLFGIGLTAEELKR